MRDDALQPIQLPTHAWTQPDTTAALRDRRVGHLFALARKYGASQTRIANVTGMGQAEVSRIQKGDRHVMTIDVLERVADGLTMPDQQRLTLGLAPRNAGSAQVVALGPEQDGDAPVLRRDFMRLSAGAFGLAATSGELDPLTISSSNPGQRIGSEVVTQMRQRIARLRQLDNHLGGADTYQLFANEAAITGQLLKGRQYTQAVKNQLLGLYAEQAQQAGWTAFDAGWHSDANEFYERSFKAAKESGDTTLVGNALAHTAYQLVSKGQPDPKLAGASCEVARKDVHPTVHALLQERCALTYATAGQVHLTEKALELSEEALAHVTEPSGPDWAAWVDSTELKIMNGRCWTALQRPLRAVPALEEALSEYSADDHARDWSLYATSLADAYIDAGEIEQAADITGRALDLSHDVASARPRMRLSSVLSRLEPYRSLPPVTDVLTRSSVDPSDIGV